MIGENDDNKTWGYYLKEKEEKPQLGVIPRFIWNEQRIVNIKKAIERRTKAFEEIPVEWVKEYNELLTNLTAVRGE